MPESGEWFSPQTRPEMLTSDDPPVRDKYNAPLEHVEILPRPATLVGRVVSAWRRVAEFIPSLGRRIVRVDDEPSRWQLAGMWTSGSAIVAGTGLAVAAVLGGAPPALTQQFDRLSVLPGLNEDSSGSEPAPDKAAVSSRDSSSRSASGPGSGPVRDRASASGSDTYYGGYSGVPGVPAGASVPADVVVPGLPSTPPSGGGGGTPTKPSGGSTAPADPGNPAPPVKDPTDPAPPVENPTDPAPPVEDPTDPAPPVADPTDPAPPVADPTDPAPPDTPPATPPAEPPADDPADPAPADPPQADSPPAAPAPVPDPAGATPTP